ncbi:hypothetical protein ACQ4PT_017262 [Festuca glaucescens]
MVAPDEPDAESVGHRRGKKAYMVETMQCLMFARDNLPSDVYNEFVNTMIEIWKQCADPDGEIRSICSENCIEEAMKLFQDCAPVKRGFLDFTQGRSPIHFLESDDADVDINASIQSPFDLLQRAKICPDISDDNYNTMLQTLADLCFTTDANHTLDGIKIKVTNTRQEGIEESLFAEEDEEDKCRTLQSSYRTKLGRSVLNDALVCGRSGSEESENSKLKAKNEYETEIFSCEVHMFESDVLLERFRSTADFIKNLQDHAGSPLNIKEHLSPLHMRCIERLYADDSELDELLESQNTSAVLTVLLSRLNQKVEGLSEARLYLHRANSQVIAKNYYRSLDHRGPSFKHLDAKRMSQKALLAEAKEINRMRLNGADEYANPDVHMDISSIISSACASEVKLMMTWTKIVHPFLSAQYMCPSLGETVAPEKACEYCGTNKDFLALPAKLPLSSKRDESPRKKSNECSYSQDGFGADIEEGEFLPDTKIIKWDVMLGPRKRPESHGVGASTGDDPSPTTHDHMNEPENQHESRQQFKRIAKPRGMKGGTCCSLVVLRRLYQILYERLRTTRELCTNDLYAEFNEKLVRLLDRSIDNYKFEDFCLKFLGPKSFKLFTLDIVINRVIKQICIISSSDQDNMLVQFLENLRRPTPPKILSQHQNFPSNLSDGLPKHAGEERDKALDDTGKLKSRHFERRKKRKLESDAVSSPRIGEGFETHNGR